jgi:hypothetical protein
MTEPPPEDPKKLTAVNLQLLKSLWLPDVEILNLKTFETLTVLSKLVSCIIFWRKTLKFSARYSRERLHIKKPPAN